MIAVDLAPGPQLVTALLAIWKLNAAYLPLDAAFPDHRVQHILKESQPALVIVENTGKWEREAILLLLLSLSKQKIKDWLFVRSVVSYCPPGCLKIILKNELNETGVTSSKLRYI